VSPSSERPHADPVAGRLARVLTASQVLAVCAVVVGLVLSPTGSGLSAQSVPYLTMMLGVGALLVGPFLGLGAVAVASARGGARWFAWGAMLVAGAGALLAALS